MGRLEPAPFKKRACDPSEHRFERNRSGMMFCVKCELSRQSLVDAVGQNPKEFP